MEKGTKGGTSNVHLYSSNLHLDLVPQELSWSRHQNYERGKRYFTYQREFISITCLSTGAARDPGHGTRDCKRCPSTSLYKLLSLNS